MSANNLEEWELCGDTHYVAVVWAKPDDKFIVHSDPKRLPVRGRRDLRFTRLDTGEVLGGAQVKKVWRLASEAEVKAKKVLS